MQEMEPNRLCWENTMEDAIAWNKYFYKHSSPLRRFRRGLLLFLVLWIVGVNLLAYGGTNLAAALLYSIYYLVAAFAIGFGLRFLIGDRLIRRQYSGEKNRGFFGAHELVLTEEGLIHRTAYSEGKMAWGLIERIESTKDHIFIYVGTNTAVIIPHERITSGQYGVFMQELGRRFKPAQPLPRPVAS